MAYRRINIPWRGSHEHQDLAAWQNANTELAKMDRCRRETDPDCHTDKPIAADTAKEYLVPFRLGGFVADRWSVCLVLAGDIAALTARR